MTYFYPLYFVRRAGAREGRDELPIDPAPPLPSAPPQAVLLIHRERRDHHKCATKCTQGPQRPSIPPPARPALTELLPALTRLPPPRPLTADGRDWEEYCQRVPYRIVPFVY